MNPPDRTKMYEDVYDLLVPGFLSAAIDLDGHRIVLRSLSNHDLYFLRQHVRENDPAWRVHLVASSIWMVDSIPLLESSLAHKVVFDTLMAAGRGLLRGALGTVYGFFSRIREANHYLEAYLYEDDSRRLWRGLANGKYPLNAKTAIPGVERIGMNPFQAAWASWNGLEDTREDHDYVWSNTKVLVSLQSHKSYESLNNRDRTREENERGRRQSVLERTLDRFQYGPPEETKGVTAHGETVQKARTNDELEDEMRRWIRGDLDEHDQIVEDYKNRIRFEQAERERQKAEVMAELRARRLTDEQALGVQKPSLKPITPEQMAALMKDKPSSGAKFIVEADSVSRTFNRFIRPTVEPGNLSVNAYGQIVEQPPVVPAGKEPGSSLAEQVAARKVVHEDG